MTAELRAVDARRVRGFDRIMIYAGACLGLSLAGSPSATAQTAQQTLEFTTANAGISIPVVNPGMGEITVYNIEHWKLSGNCSLTGGAKEMLIGRTKAAYVISFKLFVDNTVTYTKDAPSYGRNSLLIEIEGDDGALVIVPVVPGVTIRHPLRFNKLRLVYYDESNADRKINAFDYFLKSFCPGKTGAF